MKLLAARLRLPAALLAGSLVLGSGLVAWALSVHGESEGRLAAESIREASAARAATSAPEKLRIIRETTDIHARLQGSGFLGQEQRAGWITALGQAQTRLGLQTLSWRLSPRTASPVAPGLWVSTMTVSASPVDAAGLDALLGQLRQNAPGRFTVENCALSLNPGSPDGQAECRLHWWTWQDGEAPR